MTYYNQYWDQADVPVQIRELLGTHRQANAVLTYRLFDRESAVCFIEERFSAREVDAFLDCGVPAMQADFFRYCVLFADGGYYCDADTKCVQPISSLVPRGVAGILFKREWDILVNGGLYFAAPRHPLLEVVIRAATESIERRVSNRVWLTTGPGVLTYLYWSSGASSFEGVGGLTSEEERQHFSLYTRIARSYVSDLRELFRDLRLESYAELERVCPSVDADYKTTERHWVNWGEDIYRRR